MPLPACFHLADAVFPRVRAEGARRLAAVGWSQGRIASSLGVSQAMVSKYVARGAPEEDPLVLRLVEELLVETQSAHGGGHGGHHGDGAHNGSSPWCTTLTSVRASGADEALDDLLLAERRLLAEAPVAIVPEVGLNIARALPDAQGPEQVLAYPARIVAAGEQLLRPAAPALGASRHLAACLLALRTKDPSLSALANIAGSPAIARAASPDAILPPEGDRQEVFAALVHASVQTPQIVHDPGAVGIEPCLYIAGADATSVVARILEIATKVPQ